MSSPNAFENENKKSVKDGNEMLSLEV